MNFVTHWTVPLDHPAFHGHFPGTPILPGVVLLDSVLRAVAAATGATLDRCEIRSVKFLGPARPGEVLAIRHSVAASGTISFDIVSGLRNIASGSIVPGSPA
jgi:3-hydroxyacyl-[acyl-carrier-protein] dehydratase